ncbi:MAG: biopolymer transporter ExbD [Spirochaetia bacterium]|nr:biopolymer transporter ExbD [Spirochaetia bacterium]
MIKKREKERLISDINITPLTDVMLVLLIIFMVTTPFLIQGNIKINLPSAKAPSDEMLEENIVVGITTAGTVYLNGAEMKDDAQLASELKAAMARANNKRVIIEGDKDAMHGSVVRIMGIAREAGADKLAVSTIPEGAGTAAGAEEPK